MARKLQPQPVFGWALMLSKSQISPGRSALLLIDFSNISAIMISVSPLRVAFPVPYIVFGDDFLCASSFLQLPENAA